MLVKYWILTLSFCMAFVQLQGQVVFKSNEIAAVDIPSIAKDLKSFQVYDIAINELQNHIAENNGAVNIQLSLSMELQFEAHIFENNLVSDNYRLGQDNGEGRITYGAINEGLKTYSGYLVGEQDSELSLTMNHQFIFGFIKTSKEVFFVQPLEDYTKQKSDSYIIYNVKDVISNDESKCGVHDIHQVEKKIKNGNNEESLVCLEVEYALASDFLMFQEYGSVADVENRNIAVVNNVNTNYSGSFNDDLELTISEQFVSNCSSCDPWTSSTNSGTLLDDFGDWAPGGFINSFDVASLWSGRNFDGNTIGLAWVGGVCTNNFKYNVLEDFSNNANLIRVLNAHELGHNFDALHDAAGSGTIMAPSVNNTNTWSSTSIADVNSYVNGINCLSACQAPSPPTADFNVNVQNICEGNTINFYDLSSGNPSNWSWSFQGGSPSSSDERNPVITYNNNGSYNVSLTSTNNAGSDSETKNAFIQVNDNGIKLIYFEDFENGLNDWNIENPDNSDTWTQSAVSGNLKGNRAAYMNNFNYNGTGQEDRLISQSLDLGDVSEAYLSIEHAYVRYNNNNSEMLEVRVSSNGGTNYDVVFTGQENGSGNFATGNDSTNEYFPQNESDWCFHHTNSNCIELDLSAYAGNSNVKISIVNVNDFGNNMFVDNILLYSSCAASMPPTPAITSNLIEGCPVLEVNYMDQSSGNPTTWSWSFPGGNPSNSTLQNPIVNYNTSGIYDVTLQVSNAAGSNTETFQNYVTVYETPIADFDYTLDMFTADFINQSQHADNYEWNFGDGGLSNDLNPTHIYQDNGTYTVTLTTNSICGTDVYTFDVEIDVSAPDANFEADNETGCATLDVEFHDNSSGLPFAWSWEFEGGIPSISALSDPIISYPNPGSYDVTLTVTNSIGTAEIIKEDFVQVLSQPNPDFNYTVNGLTVDFENQSTDAISFSWAFDDGNNSDETNPSHTYASSGSYEVSLFATGPCGTNLITKEINISQAPTAGFGSDFNGFGCAPFQVQFADESSGSPTSWFWEFEGGSPATSTGQFPVVNYLNQGIFDVSLKVTNSEGSNTITLEDYITILSDPIALFSFTDLNGVYTFTENAQFANSISWDFGDGTSGSGPVVQHEYDNDGTYTVVLTASNQCGESTYSVDLNVNPFPTAGFTAGDTNGCAPYEIQFTNQSSSNSNAVLWEFEGGTPAATTLENPVIVYNNAGVFDVSLIAMNNEGNDTLTMDDLVIIDIIPEMLFEYEINGLTVDFTNLGQSYNEVLWTFGDGSTSTEINPTHTYDSLESFEVTLEGINNCGTDELTITVDLLNVYVYEPTYLNTINIYPNPSKGNFNISLEGKSGAHLKISMLNLLGQEFSFQEYAHFDGSEIYYVNASSFSSGTYILKLAIGEELKVLKLIIQ